MDPVVTMKVTNHGEAEQSETVSVRVGNRATITGNGAGDNMFIVVRSQLQKFEGV